MEGDVPEERDNAENDEGGEGHEAALPRAVVGVGDLQLELLVHHHVDKEPGVLGHPLDALLEGAGRGRGRGRWRWCVGNTVCAEFSLCSLYTGV